MRQPTTLAIRNRRRTRSGLTDSPLRARRSPSSQSPTALRRRGRVVYWLTTLARLPRRRKRRLLFLAIADTAPIVPIRAGRSFLVFSAGAKSRVTFRGLPPFSPAEGQAPFANSALRESSTPPESAQFADAPSQMLAAALKLWLSFNYQLRQCIVSNENNQQAF